MKVLIVSMPPMITSLIAHANACKRSRPPAHALVALGATTVNETGLEQHAWI